MAAPPKTATRKYQPIHISSTHSSYVRNVIWECARWLKPKNVYMLFQKQPWRCVLKNSCCAPVAKILSFSLECQKQPPEVFCKKGILKILANFTGKLPCRLQSCNPFKKRLQYKCCPVKFAKCLEHLFWRTSSNDCFRNPSVRIPQFHWKWTLSLIFFQKFASRFSNLLF